jgi:hypothetical protein
MMMIVIIVVSRGWDFFEGRRASAEGRPPKYRGK